MSILRVAINKVFLKVKGIYERFLLLLYNLIKNKLFQKFFLILILASSITFSIISLVLAIRIFSYTWYFLPHVIAFFTIPCFLIAISIYFIKNLDLFDLFCERVFNLFVKPWLILILIIFISLGFLFIYWGFNLPKLTKIIAVLPILPIYFIIIFFGSFESSTGYSSSTWALLFSFLILIPLMIYTFHLIGKKIISKIEISIEEKKNKNKNHIQNKNKIHDVIISDTKRPNLKKVILFIWCMSGICYFSTFLLSNFAYDTPVYYMFAKDFFETGNFDLIFNPESRSKPITDLTPEDTYSVIPPLILLICFTIICGGDLELGMLVMTTVLFSIMPPLIILITKNITNDSQIAKWAGVLYFLSFPILLLLIGILKQLLTIDIIIISLFLLTHNYKKKIMKKIAILIVFSLIIIQMIFYTYLLGIIFLILIQYFLRWRKINFSILKNPKIYRLIKFLSICLFMGLLLLFFFFGFFLNIIESTFEYLLRFTKAFYINTPQNLPGLLSSGIIAGSLGIWFIFMIIGIYIDNKDKVIKNNNIRIFLIVLLECTAIFVFLNLFGVDFIANRWIYFIPIITSIFGAIGVVKLKRIFPKILKKKPNFQGVAELSLLFTLIFANILATTYVTNAYTLQEELDALDWFKKRDDYEDLINKNTTDIQIISNAHLYYWIKYRVHYNAYIKYNIFPDLSSLRSEQLETKWKVVNLKKRAQDKLYILISKHIEQFGDENWTIGELKDFFKEYRNYYNFTWNKYHINHLVDIWEIDYID